MPDTDTIYRSLTPDIDTDIYASHLTPDTDSEHLTPDTDICYRCLISTPGS